MRFQVRPAPVFQPCVNEFGSSGETFGRGFQPGSQSTEGGFRCWRDTLGIRQRACGRRLADHSHGCRHLVALHSGIGQVVLVHMQAGGIEVSSLPEPCLALIAGLDRDALAETHSASTLLAGRLRTLTGGAGPADTISSLVGYRRQPTEGGCSWRWITLR